MSELRKIIICQAPGCQSRGSKAILRHLQGLYDQSGKDLYPQLQILPEENCGDCEQGPIVKVNDSLVLRNVDVQLADQLFKQPGAVLGSVMHVLEADRATFSRIVEGELY